jgi:tryptophanyl-tRNA synthetase
MVKKELAELSEQFFAEARERRAAIESQPERVREILAAGATNARKKASEVLQRAQAACGLS